MPLMQYRNEQGVRTTVFDVSEHNPQFIRFKKLNEIGFINHCFSTRLGGVSTGIYESLNLSSDRGDKEENITRNFEIICDRMEVEFQSLVRSFADCVPLYFVDLKNKAIGLSHSGWKGTVGKIGEQTLISMKKNYGTEPKDVIAAIGQAKDNVVV